MRTRSTDARPASFLPLSPVVFEILVSLASGNRHGYGIITEVRDRAAINVRPGSLYRALNRLLEDELIVEIDERPEPERDDERRRYYHLTPLGMSVARAEAARLEAQVRGARAARLLGRR